VDQLSCLHNIHDIPVVWIPYRPSCFSPYYVLETLRNPTVSSRFCLVALPNTTKASFSHFPGFNPGTKYGFADDFADCKILMVRFGTTFAPGFRRDPALHALSRAREEQCRPNLWGSIRLLARPPGTESVTPPSFSQPILTGFCDLDGV